VKRKVTQSTDILIVGSASSSSAVTSKQREFEATCVGKPVWTEDEWLDVSALH
jgi:hypothetical protein